MSDRIGPPGIAVGGDEPGHRVPDQAGGQRAADNQQRAAEVFGVGKPRPETVRAVAAALDEAEARGRAERNTVWKAKVEALAAEVQSGVPGLARRLRALVAELAPGAQTDGEAGR